MNGRKRHIIVDTQGFLLVSEVTAANINDRSALSFMTSRLRDKFPLVKHLWADMGYQGKDLKSALKAQGIELDIVKRPRKYVYVPQGVEDVQAYLRSIGHEVSEGFKVLPRRWVVERTFAWIGRYRRMSKDYEFLTKTQEMMMWLAMTSTMLRRIVSMLN